MRMPLPKCKVPKAITTLILQKGEQKVCQAEGAALLSTKCNCALLNRVNTCSMIRISPSFILVLELHEGLTLLPPRAHKPCRNGGRNDLPPGGIIETWLCGNSSLLGDGNSQPEVSCSR